MKEQDRTKEQLINELTELRQRIAELEKSEAERKRAEEALKESEAKYKSLFEGSHDAILLADPETGRFVDCNRKTEELSGYSRDEILCMKVGQFSAGDIKGETADEFQKLIAGKGIQKEWEILTKDGNRMPAEISSILIRVGNKSYLQGVVRDITERKRAERTLRESEERFRSSVETMLEGFAIFSAVRDDAGHIIDFQYDYINEAGCKMNQKPREEHIGRTLLKLFPKEKEIGLFDDYVEVMETGQSLVKEYAIYESVYGGGERLKQAFDVRIIRLEDGVVVTWQDVTEKKKGEELLRQSEERLKRLIENSKDIIVMADLEGRVLYYNGPPEYGVRTEDVLGKNAFSIFEPVIAARLMNQLRRVVKEKEALTIENFISWRGEPFWFSTHMYPIQDEQNRMYAAGIIARNITERKRSEEVLRRSEASYRELADSITDIFFAFDKDLRYTYWNKASEELTEIPARDAIGKFLYELFPDTTEIRRAERVYLDALRTQQPQSFVNEHHHGGKNYFFEISAYPSMSGLSVFVKDITGRKRMEEILEKEQQELKLIIDSSPIIVFYKDKEGKFIRVNRAFSEALKMHEEEFVGKTVFDLYSTKIAQRMTDDDQEVLESGNPKLNIIEPYESASGIRWVQTDKIPIYDKNCNPVGLIGFAQDITERKRVEEALRENEGKYRDLVESISDVVYAIDSSGMLTYISPVVKNTLGYEPDELIGRQFLELVHKEDHDLLTRRFSELRERIVRHSDYRVIGKQGDIKWVRTLTNPVVEEGGFAGARGVLIDITERKRIEEAFRKSEVLHKEAQKTAHIGHWELDTSIMVPTWSEEIFRIFGLDPQKDPPSFAAHQKVTHPDDWNILDNAMTRSINEGIPFDIDFRILRPDKTIRWMHAIGNPKKDSEGRIVSVFGTAQDVTESKQAEDQLRNSHEQLRALSTHLQSIREEERTLMAREIHDELGQELTGLKMDLTWLRRRLSKNQKSLISKTESMLKLVDSAIGSVRRIASDLRPGVLDDLGLIAAIEWQTQDFENRTGITSVFSSNLEEIELDRDRSTAVFRIFQEALTNVSRHADATRAKINLEAGADALILGIEDNGKGIKESEISHPKSLGLLGMKERALVFGGEVIIRGTAGKGTTVTVTIPMRQSERVKSEKVKDERRKYE